MPWLPMYVAQDDSAILAEELSRDSEIAFLVSDGLKRWRAVKSLDLVGSIRIGLWHIPSGPLPLLPSISSEPITQVHDPWAGWAEKRSGADPTTPYFGAGHPGIVWLNLRLVGRDQNSCCGFSSFEWIGNHYKAIGNGACESTAIWWKSLRRRIAKLSHKVPRQRLSSTLPPEVFALPNAYSSLVAGDVADANP
jgi:hypothetical protein